MDSNSSISLTLNGVLYLSLGFKQHFQLQVLAVKVGEQAELQLVLYDGLSYIGALYYPPMAEEDESQKVRERDIVKIYPISAVRNQPVILESLQIIASPLEQFLGREIISLEELMRRKSKNLKPFPNTHKIEDTQPRKIIKTNPQQGKLQPQQKIIFESQPENIEQQPEKYSICSSKHQQTENTLAINKQSNLLNPIQSLQTQKTTSIREDLISVEVESNDDIVQEILTQKKMNGNKEPQYVYQISSQEQPISFSIAQKNRRKDKQLILEGQTGEAQSLQIRDLYQRMHRFQIQCRINYLNSFTSQKGTKCIRLVAIDSLGDEIICLLFENHNQNMTAIKLQRGKTYIFKNGEVQSSESGLTVILPWNGITESSKNLPNFLPQRMMRAGEIERKLSVFMDKSTPSDNSKTGTKNEEHNFSGIFMGFKQNPKILKNGFRVTGTLCDPDQRVCVIFSMVADELSSFPTEGTVVSLHNFTIMEEDRIIRLESTRKGYIIDEAYNYHDYFSDLKQSAANGEWRRMDLRNISQVSYNHRNIGQLRRLMSRTIDFQQIYSEFDCFITHITEKIKYSSCIVCRKAMKQEIGPISYCLNCKKPQPSITRFIFQLQVADSTGSIEVVYSRDQLDEVLGMNLQQYSSYDEQQRKHYLQLTRYKCIVVRLRSQRVTGGEKHQAVLISKLIPQRSLQQIKELAIEEKTNFSRAF